MLFPCLRYAFLTLLISFSLTANAGIEIDQDAFAEAKQNLCKNSNVFPIEVFHHLDTFNKVFLGVPPYCDAFEGISSDEVIQKDEEGKKKIVLMPNLKSLDFSTTDTYHAYMNKLIAWDVVREKAGLYESSHANPSRHQMSTVLALAVGRVWPRLNESERLSLITDPKCGAKSKFSMLPTFNNYRKNPGPGWSQGLQKMKELCRVDNFAELFSKVPRGLLTEAATLMVLTGMNGNLFLFNLCESFKKHPMLYDHESAEVFSDKAGVEGAIDRFTESYLTFAIHPKSIIQHFSYNEDPANLSKEQKEAINTWTSEKYFWVLNRERFGLLGDLISHHFRNGDHIAPPENLGKVINDLKAAIEELPKHEGLVFRGETRENAESYYRKGRLITFNSLTSTSADFGVAVHFARDWKRNEDYDPSVPEAFRRDKENFPEEDYEKLYERYREEDLKENAVILVIEGKSGVNITSHSDFKNELEVLYAPGAQFEVTSTEPLGESGGLKVFLKEK